MNFFLMLLACAGCGAPDPQLWWCGRAGGLVAG